MTSARAMTKTKDCDKGWECGDTCISRKVKCPLENSPTASASLDQVSKVITSLSTTNKTLSDLSAYSKDLLSDASKKAYRALIKGDPQERALKTQRLKDENEAWVFLRFYRKISKLERENSKVSIEEASAIKKRLVEAFVNRNEESMEKLRVELSVSIETRRAERIIKISATGSPSALKAEALAELIATAATNSSSGRGRDRALLPEATERFEEFDGYSNDLRQQIDSATKDSMARAKKVKESLGPNEKYHILRDNGRIWQGIRADNDNKQFGGQEKIMCVKSGVDGRILEGAMSYVYSEDRPVLKIDWLATNPKNLDSANKDYRRGAGTSLIIEAAKLAQEQGLSLVLTPLEKAKPFYMKFGFEEFEDEDGDEELRLSPQKIEELLVKVSDGESSQQSKQLRVSYGVSSRLQKKIDANEAASAMTMGISGSNGESHKEIDNRQVWSSIALFNAGLDGDGENFVISLENDNKLEGAMAINMSERTDDIKIKYLATNPKNLDPSNKDYVRGVGTTLIIEAAKLAKKNSRPLTLSPLKSAIAFYMKLGFVFPVAGLNMMELSVAEIDKLLERLGIEL